VSALSIAGLFAHVGLTPVQYRRPSRFRGVLRVLIIGDTETNTQSVSDQRILCVDLQPAAIERAASHQRTDQGLSAWRAPLVVSGAGWRWKTTGLRGNTDSHVAPAEQAVIADLCLLI